MKKQSSDTIRQLVREHYGKVAAGGGCSCGTVPNEGCCSPGVQAADSIGKVLGYSNEDFASVVEGANMNLGCGNPVAIGQLKKGESVLDIGSGGGFDSFLAAKAVGPQGRVIGVDMTPEMLTKARENARKMKTENVTFRLGEIEHLPVANSTVDVILSNCVVNLSPDKKSVWREAFRVLRPGGRLAISDVVATSEIPEPMKEQTALLTGCIAGADLVDNIEAQLREVGFENVNIEIRPESKRFLQHWFPESGAEHYVASAHIEARKPRHAALILPDGDGWIQDVRQQAAENMTRNGNCTQSIVAAFAELLDLDNNRVLKAASGFMGGMVSSLTCGVHSAGVIVLGMIMGRERLEEGRDGLLPMVFPTQELIRRLNARLGSHSCRELTGTDFTDLEQAKAYYTSDEHQKCIARVANGAEETAKLIKDKYSAGEII
jgi:arsenite methyltransferase